MENNNVYFSAVFRNSPSLPSAFHVLLSSSVVSPISYPAAGGVLRRVGSFFDAGEPVLSAPVALRESALSSGGNAGSRRC